MEIQKIDIDNSGNSIQPIDDGLLARTAGSWTEEKLDYLIRYLDIFTTSMKGKPWRSINYIDLFSGPGKCKIRDTNRIVLGSPLLALCLQNPFDNYFFVDNNPENIIVLQQRCSQTKLFSKTNFQVGDCNQVVNKITNTIQQLDLVFIKDK